MKPRCNTLLCGNDAVWQCAIHTNLGQPATIYKCAICYDRNMAVYTGDWKMIEPIKQSRIVGLRPPNVKLR